MCGRIANTMPHDAMAQLFVAKPDNDLPEVPNRTFARRMLSTRLWLMMGSGNCNPCVGALFPVGTKSQIMAHFDQRLDRKNCRKVSV
jgi:hypothetical protein